MTHIADNHDALLDYLYEEGDPTERLTIARHLQECAACSVAVLEFQNVRGMLHDWTPPAADLGFRLVQDVQDSEQPPSASPDQRARSGWSRGWGLGAYRGMLQAAAAVVLFVGGMAVSQLTLAYGDGALIVRTRSAVPAASVRNASITLPAQQSSSTAGPVNIDEIERELRARLEGQDASSTDTERLLQRVRAMIDQSEQRQQQLLALRLSQVAREVDTQHQVDLQKIQQDFGKQQEATMDYLVRTSGGVK